MIEDFPSHYITPIFLMNKMFLMIFRGTIDNQDYDKNLSKYKQDYDLFPQKM
jgi:hypothetical protein